MGILSALVRKPAMGEVVPFKREQHDAHVWIWQAINLATPKRPPLVRDKAYDDADFVVGFEIEPKKVKRMR